MNANNQRYRMFNLMMHGYATENKDELEQGARCLLDLAEENPFQEGTDEMEAFFQMKRCYSIWKSGAIDHKVNRRRMISWTEKLCALNPKNPYKYDKKAEDEERAKKAPEIKVEPEKKDEPEKAPEATQEEKKNWLKFLFPWKKEDEPNDSTRSN